jgi:hypothetical protein
MPDNPFADLMPAPATGLALAPSHQDYGPFADLIDDPALLTAAAANEPLPSKELIGGGTPDAPAFQAVNGKVSNISIMRMMLAVFVFLILGDAVCVHAGKSNSTAKILDQVERKFLIDPSSASIALRRASLKVSQNLGL